MSSLSFLGALGVFFIFISFFGESDLSKQNSPRWDAASGAILLPMTHKKTPGLYGFSMPMESAIRIDERPTCPILLTLTQSNTSNKTNRMNYIDDNFTSSQRLKVIKAFSFAFKGNMKKNLLVIDIGCRFDKNA